MNQQAILKRFQLQIMLLVLAFAVWFFAMPEIEALSDAASSRLERLDRELRSLNAQAQVLGNDLAALKTLRSEHERLDGAGFTRPLDRLEAALAIEQLARRHVLSSAQYAFSPERPDGNRGLRRQEMEVVTTPVDLSLKAAYDVPVYAFLDELAATLPGHVSWRRMTIVKVARINLDTVSRTYAGRPDLLSADVGLVWRRVRDNAAPAAGATQ